MTDVQESNDVQMADASTEVCHLLVHQTLEKFIRIFLNSLMHVPPFGFQQSKKKSSLPAPKFEIKKWNAVAMWSWDICADTVSFFFFSHQMHHPEAILKYLVK
jgi:hypothetical protein